MKARWLLRLYPRAWRNRYGAEFLALVDATPVTTSTALDVLRSAGGEWLHEGRSHKADVLSVVRAAIGYYCISHIVLFFLSLLSGRPTAQLWSAEGLWMSASVQLRAAVVAFVVASFVVRQVRSGRSPGSRKFAREWGGAIISFGSMMLLLASQDIGLGPDRAEVADVLGRGSVLAIGSITWVMVWADGAIRKASAS